MMLNISVGNMESYGWCMLLFCLESILHLTQGELQCPPGYRIFHEECLKRQEGSMPWNQAAGFCHSRDASLLSIENQEKNDFIRDSRICGMDRCWLDLKRHNVGGPFVWQETGSGVDFAHWFRTQPDNGQMRCVSIRHTSWENRYCKYELQYICEKPESHGCDAQSWLSYSGSCYKKFSDPVSWSEARESCQNDMADLAVIETSEEDEFLTGAYADNSQGIWIGLHLNNDNHWTWLDQTDELITWVNWNSFRPSIPDNLFKDCVYMRLSERSMWDDTRKTEETWSTDSCEMSLASICEAPIDDDSRCRNGWIYYDGSCYHLASHPLSWEQARAQCQSYGADLVVVDSRHENSFLIDVIDETSWIGLHNIDESNVWGWLDGQQLLDFSDFEEDLEETLLSQPDVYNCVMLYTNRDNLGKWANQECALSFGVICESPNPIDMWLSHNGRYYSFNTEGLIDWYQARERCKRYDQEADLVVIESYSEQRFINGEIAGMEHVPGFWTGMNSLVHRYRFTGLQEDSELMFTNWDYNEPVYIEDENCAIVRVPLYENGFLNQVNNDYQLSSSGPANAYWDDVACKTLGSPVCQLPAVGEPSYYDLRHADKVYKYVSGEFTAAAGLEYCASQFGSGATLVHFDNEEQDKAVANHYLSVHLGFLEKLEFWIGALYYPITDPAESRCNQGHLNLQPGNMIGSTGQDCDWTGDILCEKTIEPSMDIADFTHGRSAYKVMTGQVTMDEAEMICGQTLPGGGKLLEIYSQEEFDEVQRELIIRHLGQEFKYWLFGSIDDHFLYHSIVKLPELDEHCLMLSLPSFPNITETSEMFVMPTICDGVKYFVCEQENF